MQSRMQSRMQSNEYAIVNSGVELNTPQLKLDTQSKILQAAISIFSDVGFESASLRQITTLAGVNHGSIKYHYNSKEELWQSCVLYLYAELENAFKIPDMDWEKLTLLEKTEHSMRTYVRFLAKNPELFKITMFETMHDSPRLDWLTKNITTPYTEQSLVWIRKAKNAGIYPSNIPDMNMFYLLLGASRYLYLVAPEASKVFNKNLSSDEQIKRHEDAVIQLFLGSFINADNTCSGDTS